MSIQRSNASAQRHPFAITVAIPATRNGASWWPPFHFSWISINSVMLSNGTAIGIRCCKRTALQGSGPSIVAALSSCAVLLGRY